MRTKQKKNSLDRLVNHCENFYTEINDYFEIDSKGCLKSIRGKCYSVNGYVVKIKFFYEKHF